MNDRTARVIERRLRFFVRDRDAFARRDKKKNTKRDSNDNMPQAYDTVGHWCTNLACHVAHTDDKTSSQLSKAIRRYSASRKIEPLGLRKLNSWGKRKVQLTSPAHTKRKQVMYA